jgi:hypothetical protein
LRVFVVVLVAVLAAGTLGFAMVEDLPLADAIYFSVVTVATVGYGDIHPLTPIGKVLAVLLIVTGVGSFLGVIGNATEIMLNRRERNQRLQKLNMVQDLFFGEIGTDLIALFAEFDPDIDALRRKLVITGKWSRNDFDSVKDVLNHHAFNIDPEATDFTKIRELLDRHKSFLLRLLENPALLEDESFTEVLRAAFHLNAELQSRKELMSLPPSDRSHLAGDVRRVYSLLVHHWLTYMEHLKEHYPYLFSLAMRTNPFDPEATPVVT